MWKNLIIAWIAAFGYRENSHQDNSRKENPHQSNFLIVNSPQKIPTHVFKYSHPGALIFSQTLYLSWLEKDKNVKACW